MLRQKSRFFFESKGAATLAEMGERNYWQAICMESGERARERERENGYITLHKESVLRNWIQNRKTGTLIQNGPHSGQAIDHVDGRIMAVHDFVGTFDVDGYNTIFVQRLDMHTKQFEFSTKECKYQMLVRECNAREGGIGAGCWLSSVAMLAWITENAHVFVGKKVMEMGCGIGLCSLGLSSMIRDTSITASDCYSALAETFDKNVELNGIDKSNTSFKLMDWDATADAQVENTGEYDIIIATDCIYKSTADSFKQAALKHLAPNGKLFMINPFGVSRPGVDTFVYSLAECGEVEKRRIEICMDAYFSLELMFIEYTHASTSTHDE